MSRNENFNRYIVYFYEKTPCTGSVNLLFTFHQVIQSSKTLYDFVMGQVQSNTFNYQTMFTTPVFDFHVCLLKHIHEALAHAASQESGGQLPELFEILTMSHNFFVWLNHAIRCVEFTEGPIEGQITQPEYFRWLILITFIKSFEGQDYLK